MSYKIISKFLVHSLQTLLSKLISPSHAAFIPNWRATDCIIIAKELIHMMSQTTHKKPIAAVKLDISKAYDY